MDCEEEQAIEKYTPDEDVCHNSGRKVSGVDHRGSVAEQGHKIPGLWSRDNRPLC